MVAEMYEHDNAVYHKEPAWHGLGYVVDEALSPTEAAKWIMPYTILQKPLTYKVDGETVVCESHVINLRSDTKEEMGLVSANYVPIQNDQVAEFCEALLSEGDVKVESAGTIRNGRRIWFLLKGEPFEVAIHDQIAPYLLVSNGHDGSTTFRVTPTTVRVVCSNTLHMVVPRMDTGQLMGSAVSIRHTVNIMERVNEAQMALAVYRRSLEEMRGKVIKPLADRQVRREDVEQFFLESYTADFGEIPMNPQTKVEENRRERAMSALQSFSRRFDDEKADSGTSAWCMFNAYSGLVQHDKKSRGGDDAERVGRRIYQNLFGLNQDRTQDALVRAFQFSTAG